MSTAARISLIYFAVGSFFVGISNTIFANILVPSTTNPLPLQLARGWGFMAITALVLYFALRREFGARAASEERVRVRGIGFHDLFENNPVPMWVYNRQTLEFLDVNSAACLLYGYPRDEFLRMKITEIRPSEEIPRVVEFLNNPNPDFSVTDEWRHRKKDGQLFDVAATAHTLEYMNKAAVMVAVQDISERKRLEEIRMEAENLRVRLAQESGMHSMRTRFISMVSHEFRRPLTTITTSIDLLENYRDRMNEEAAKKHFARIHERLGEMQDLVDDFLTLMNTEVSQQVKTTNFDLTELCATLVDEARLAAKASHNVQFVTNCPPILVDADQKMIRHAVGNLLSNAVKYSPDGGEVVLDLAQTDAIYLRVRDQGIGIPPQDQEKLFDPFFRASNVGDVNGTGLGLPIARQGIELHGGTLTIPRSDATGTEFLITLPLVRVNSNGMFTTV